MNTSCYSEMSGSLMLSFNSSDSSVCETVPTTRPEVAKQLEKCVLNGMKYNNPLTCLESSVRILNEAPGAKFQLPETKYQVRRAIEPAFEFEFHYECKKCDTFSGIPSKGANKEQAVCVYCGDIIEKKSDNFFIYIPLQQQLQKSIRDNWDSIIRFRETERDENYVCDVRDGSICKKIDAKFPNSFNLSLVLDTDGAQVFKSAKKSLWPLQIIQNFLHPRIRYLSSNIIVVGLHFGRVKPDPAKFFFPLINELKKIHQAGGFKIETLSKKIVFLPFISHCSCDLPAKASCQGMLQFNGKCACGFCLHPGIAFENEKLSENKTKKKTTYRYVRLDSPILLRTHADTVSALLKLEKDPETPILGFKNISCLIAAPQFDLIHGFCLDYMHCILLGTTCKLAGLWLDTKNCRAAYYIKKKTLLDDRIKSIRPPSVINRKPRSLDERKLFKANEWRSLLLYYLRYCLVGFLPFKYIDHFELLSSATYILSKEKIHVNEIEEAKAMLIRFANDFEILYGKEKVTMNIHLLRHLADSVLHSGPLWSQSMFAFERSNGELVKSVNGCSHVLHQITEKYILRNTIKPEEKTSDNLTLRNRKNDLCPSVKERVLLSKYGIIQDDEITFWASVEIKCGKFTSIIYKKTKSIDYFAVFANNQMGIINYYVKCNELIYALVEIYIAVENKNHLIEVISKESISLFLVEDIREKLIYMEIGSKKIVCRIPNRFEKT